MYVNLYYLKEEERREREKLATEWKTQQEKIKSCDLNIWQTYLMLPPCTDEDIAITYSYWDGSGHRRTTTVRCLPNIIMLLW